MQNYEESVSFLRTWGPFQRKIFVVLCLACVPCGYNILSVIFLLASPPHHCDIPDHSNLSQEWIHASIPVKQVAGQLTRSSCSRYELDLVRNLSTMGASPNWMQNQSAQQGLRPEVLSNLRQEDCKDGWTHSTEYFQSTVVTETWRHLSLTMSLPGLACIPLWWLVPESPRWLLSHGHLPEAELLLRSAALENQVEAPTVIFLPPKAERAGSQKAESVSFLGLLKTANIRRVTMKLWLIWFSMSICYFGLSFSMSTLYGNPFLNYFLLTAVELPAFFASWLAARSFPRRLSFISFSLLGALALLFIQVTMHSHPDLTMFLVLLGKFGVLAGNGLVYTYTGELFPTVIRNTAMSSCAMFSKVGSSVSPYLLEMAGFNELLPWIIVGVLSLLNIFLCIFLPETFRQPLPDTIEQMPVTQWFT
ncbi:solute carrier family 22 member 5-like [Girardinichthys multiradiatus]|uniref:solute carrier family 22 member 5-like n=1 Tax=Girardinichthys multiradiatus TaxID=208333 RepID=UPI001FACD930|nr:solute carrier family 22 member 5-like [Girardinichthys multiradiatus]